MNNLGIVAIGRNEGDRLILCLDSLNQLLPKSVPIIYVDSGSTDNSIAEARTRGAHVLPLDMSIPFTGARARNEGFDHLVTHFPAVEYVQFIDGDCEILPGWIESAIDELEQSPHLAVAFGRLLERFPEASPYNRVAAMDWNVPVGEAFACGGLAMMRVSAVREVGGFNEKMICGEEPDLCIRLRQKGWIIWRVDRDMAFHDIDMHRFGQWWKRSVRGGWAVAEGKAMYGNTVERYMNRESFSGWIWGAIIPLVTISLAGLSHGMTILLLLAGYLLLAIKIYRHRQQLGEPVQHAAVYAFFCVVSKLPQVIGQAKYWINRWQAKPATLIEYKG